MTMQGDAKRNAKLTHGLKNVSKNLVNFLASSRKSENLHFDGFLLYKAYKVFVEKVQKIYVSWQWRVTQSLKKNWLLVNFIASNGKPENLTLMCYFCRKYIMFEPKKYRGVMWHDTEERCKIWAMTCPLKNDIRNLTNFDPTLQSLKIYTLMDSFWPKYKMFELKKYRGVMYHYNEDRYKHFKKNNL